MKITIHTQKDIKKMILVGQLTAEVLKMIKHYIKPNVSTNYLNNICHNYIVKKQKAIPAALGYNGFPKSVCISVNDEVCHGIPSDLKILKEGDIINIDVSIIKNKYYGDSSKMFSVGKISKKSKKICKVAKKSLYKAIQILKPGLNINYIGKTIQKYVEKKKFSIVREYCGHGIGKNFHMPPYILHYFDKKEKNLLLKKGMIFTIEPMINQGKQYVYQEDDGWTIKTKDKSISAQYEHTVLITKKKYKILTSRKL
ncbi:type I methionyl aminopeptidase [Buchnera aphidicola]|uniref:type I methionyl aminopeptidase n=1 Tax=Buchnera aphidicola TaxID=9 RepID=UPI0030ED2072